MQFSQKPGYKVEKLGGWFIFYIADIAKQIEEGA